MSANKNQGQLDPFTQDLICRKARQLVRRPGFTPSDREDVEQELALRLWQRLGDLDPERNSRGFVVTVINRCAANIARDHCAEKRDARRVVSLNRRSSQGADSAENLAQNVHDARLGRRRRDDVDHATLAADVADLLARLPANLRELAERLRSQSVREAAWAMGVPRTTLHGWVHQLLQRFVDAGLGDYLEKRPSARDCTG